MSLSLHEMIFNQRGTRQHGAHQVYQFPPTHLEKWDVNS